MRREMTEQIAEWDGLAVVTRYDRPSGAWFFIAIHDDTLGQPVGGCRLKVYDAPEDGLRDALRLAEGMTRKWAAIGFPFGGGKAVIAAPRIPEGEERRALFTRFGELLGSLRGSYATGEDMGVDLQDMRVIAATGPYVAGPDPSDDDRDPGPYTALGVHAGIRVALDHRLGSPDLEGRRVLVQGCGSVGRPLLRLLADDGAQLLINDRDPEIAANLAAELGGEVVEGARIWETPCDVFAPCAVGGILNRETIPSLRTRIVAGSANNQLETPADAERLKARGILYAPDYVINAGGAMGYGMLHLGETDLEVVRSRVRAIGDTLAELFAEAAARGESPVAAAARRVDRVLTEARENRKTEQLAAT